MTPNSIDPHQRKGTPLFNAAQAKGGSSKPVPAGAPTLPYGVPINPIGIAEDSPTLPMPGPGATVPLVPKVNSSPQTPGYPTPPVSAGTPHKENLGPVAGWLVVVSGPGRGRSVEVGYGYNSIGRNPSNEICLPFNDTSISDVGHAFLAYDNRGHRSYVTHGQGRNMIYLNDTPVLGTVEITAGSALRIGNTVLIFVPFCSMERNWDMFPETVE